MTAIEMSIKVPQQFCDFWARPRPCPGSGC